MRLGLLGLGRIGAFHAETLTSLLQIAPGSGRPFFYRCHWRVSRPG